MLQHGPPVEARRASSVLLIDHRSQPWTLLMMRRPGGADFAPSAYVFPGGAEQPGDGALGDGARVAAVRELFEEMGMLLARRADGRFATDRDARVLGEAIQVAGGFAAGLRASGLTPALDRLAPLTRWITPEAIRRRFDTRFFVARRPSGQTVRAQADEVDDWLWISPGEALAAGGPTLVHATRRILEAIVAEPEPARLIARARRRRERPPVIPVVAPLADGPGFSVSDESMPL